MAFQLSGIGSLCFCLVAFVMAIFLDNSGLVAADCSNTSIGLESFYIIPNSSFTASSHYNSKYIPSNARLNGYNGWGPGIPRRDNEYLQVDLGYPYVICAIATQGSSEVNEWVKEYRVTTSMYGTEWNDYEENGKVKTFTGNTDRNTVVKNTMKKPFARYVRIYPTSSEVWNTMRVGLFGYPETCDNLPLGMESKVIQNITASSGQDPATSSRLRYPGTSWCALRSDVNPYLQIDLGSYHLICAVATQGNNQSNQWVKRYQIDTSTDGTIWTTYQENNIDREFVGNFDRSTVLRQVLFHGTITRYIRIKPKTFENTPCLRTEIYGYRVNQTCSRHSLGLPSFNMVPDYRFTATSHFNQEHQSFMARLGLRAAWGPTEKESFDYLQIDLGAVAYICSVESQGNGNPSLYEWITKYQVLYSTSNNQWITYRENGTDKEFPGNTDQSTIVINSIKNLFEAKFIRILPKNFNRWKSIRLDFKGLPAACVSSLGLENSHIPDSEITSSSSSDNSHTAAHGRLYGSSSWCSSSSSNSEYIQVNLGEVKIVTGVATQGDKNLNKWVTSYKVSHSFLSDRNWNVFGKVFSGNDNNTDVIVNWFSSPITAHYVRILPQSNNGGPCLRFDFYGCTYHIPERPSSSSEVTVGEKTATLRWTDIQTHEGTAEKFTISVSNRTGLAQNIIVQNQPTTSKEITNLKPYTKYDVKIIAVKSDGRHLWKSILQFLTLIAVPEGRPTIERLTATSSQNISVTIKFTEMDKLNGPFVGYRIAYKPDGGQEKTIDVGTVTPVLLTNLKKYTRYTVSVSVRNSKFVGPKSDEKQQRTLEDVPETEPRISETKKLNDTTYQITWQPLTAVQSNGIITKYEVIWHRETTRPTASCKEFLTASTQESNFVIQNLKLNQKYTVIVRAHTRIGPGPNSTSSFLTSTSETKSSKSSLCTTEGNTITLGCLTNHEQAGSIRYTWTKNGEVVVAGNSAAEIKGNKLIVNSVKEDDFGSYECNATNDEGTVIFTTSRYELKKCSNDEISSRGQGGTNVMYIILPLVAIVVFMFVCIAYLIFRLQRANRNSQRQNQMEEANVNEGLVNGVVHNPDRDDEEEAPNPPGVVPRGGGHNNPDYMEIPAGQGTSATYESLDDAARAAQENMGGNYMELKPVKQSTYETLTRDGGGEGLQPPDRYSKTPGHENKALEMSNA